MSRELEAARARYASQLALQRDREAAVVAGLGAYFDAGQKIVAAEAECEERVRPLERAIAELREKRDRVVAEQEAEQARAALSIHESDRTVEQVGELLELSEKAARKLIGEGRQAAGRDEPAAQVASRESASTPVPEADGPEAVADAPAPSGGVDGMGPTSSPAWAG
ncbi:hypothetical protein [Actinokineospora iranica]|uniref:hypothetical protein n=1 Tax=Actinokineospora iranica TaxID=1271860 RepID=UPI000B85362F|nr:hypothetical protein [Actinokineospora iranica]